MSPHLRQFSVAKSCSKKNTKCDWHLLVLSYRFPHYPSSASLISVVLGHWALRTDPLEPLALGGPRTGQQRQFVCSPAKKAHMLALGPTPLLQSSHLHLTSAICQPLAHGCCAKLRSPTLVLPSTWRYSFVSANTLPRQPTLLRHDTDRTVSAARVYTVHAVAYTLSAATPGNCVSANPRNRVGRLRASL